MGYVKLVYMSIITTKQLRENMPQVVRNLQMGQPVQLSYRHRVIGTIQPVQLVTMPLRRGSAKAVQAFLESASFGHIPHQLRESTTTFKDQVSELRSHKLNNL